MTLTVLTESDLDPLLDWPSMVAALRAGHRMKKAEIGDQFLTRGDKTLLSRAAWKPGLGIGVKSVTVLPDNPAAGRPTVHGAMVLFDEQTGMLDAVIDSAVITKWKTAADSLLGASLLARPDSRRLTILGAGAVAASLIDGYHALFPGIEITLWNRSPARAEELAAQKSVAFSTDKAAALAEADIIATATLSAEPVLPGAMLRPGQHLDLIGAFTPQMREADDEALKRSRIFVDSRDSTVGHIGELMIPLKSGAIAPQDVLGDYYDLVDGPAGRQSDDDITLCKNGGGAHLDLICARHMLERWQASMTGEVR